MRYKLTAAEYEKIDRLVKCALSASNKAEAKRYIQQFEYMGRDLFGSAKNILRDLVSSTIRASGRVADKERLISYATEDLYKLESFVEEGAPRD